MQQGLIIWEVLFQTVLLLFFGNAFIELEKAQFQLLS